MLHEVGKENHENGGFTLEIFIRINSREIFTKIVFFIM